MAGFQKPVRRARLQSVYIMTIINQFSLLFALLIAIGILALLARGRSVRTRKIIQGVGGAALIGGGLWILSPKIEATSPAQATQIIADTPEQTAVLLDFYSDY